MPDNTAKISQQPTANSHNSDLKILVCYHKPYIMPPLDNGILLPIHVGKAISDTELHIQGDNELNGQPCDNISAKNESYCELTAIYWAWKNLKKLYPDVKYVGLYHYRRFFAFSGKHFWEEEINLPECEIENYRINLPEVMKILESNDIILGRKIYTHYPMDVYYSSSHNSEDYRILRDAVENEFSDYFPAFVKFCEQNNKYSARNMFIMKYDDFADYCGWLFAVLSEIESKVPFMHYNEYQKRVFGFMAERLLNIYALKRKMKVKYLNIFHYDDSNNSTGGLGHALKMLLSHCKDELIFKLIRL